MIRHYVAFITTALLTTQALYSSEPRPATANVISSPRVAFAAYRKGGAFTSEHKQQSCCLHVPCCGCKMWCCACVVQCKIKTLPTRQLTVMANMQSQVIGHHARTSSDFRLVAAARDAAREAIGMTAEDAATAVATERKKIAAALGTTVTQPSAGSLPSPSTTAPTPPIMERNNSKEEA